MDHRNERFKVSNKLKVHLLVAFLLTIFKCRKGKTGMSSRRIISLELKITRLRFSAFQARRKKIK